MTPRRIDVEIGALVVEGARVGREEVESALGRELGRLLVSRGLAAIDRDRGVPVARVELGRRGPGGSDGISSAVASAVVAELAR